jgi:transcription-repair coupling factor (superfamily II helicase)
MWNKVFQENRESFLIIFQRKRCLFKTIKDLQLDEGRRSFEKLSTDIKHATPDQLF